MSTFYYATFWDVVCTGIYYYYWNVLEIFEKYHASKNISHHFCTKILAFSRRSYLMSKLDNSLKYFFYFSDALEGGINAPQPA